MERPAGVLPEPVLAGTISRLAGFGGIAVALPAWPLTTVTFNQLGPTALLVLVETEKVIGVEVLPTLTSEDGVRFTEAPMDPLPDTLEGDTVRVGGDVAS